MATRTRADSSTLRSTRAALLLILGIAAVIRFHALNRFSYGLDEILQTYWMNGDWSFFWRSIRFDAVHPPFDYVIARLWEALDPSDAARKFPVILYGIAAVAAFGWLVARRAGVAVGLVAAALLTLAPFHVRYSQELRPYSLALLLLCTSLLWLDRFLETPGAGRLLLLFLFCVACFYTSYILQGILCGAGLAMLATDAVGPDGSRSRNARRALLWSPLFLLAVVAAYLPWWPVQAEAAARTLPIHPPALLGWPRVGRLLAFFSSSSDGSDAFRLRDLVFLLLVLAGSVLAAARPRLRFLLAWGFGGMAAIEVLWRLHPHWDVARIYLPAGIAVIAIAAIPIGALLERRKWRLPGAVLLAALLSVDASGLFSYFQNGRADWRPLARDLRLRPAAEWVFTENAYTALCLGFYVDGPRSAYRDFKVGRPVRSLDGEGLRLAWSWPRDTTTWVVIGPGTTYPDLRDWLKQFPSREYASAEGAVLYRLDPEVRDRAFQGPRAPRH